MRKTDKAAAVLILSLCAVPTRADDLSGRLGVGGTVGIAGPLGSKAFYDRNSAGADLGGWVRYGLSRRWTAGASWEGIDFSRGPGLIRPLQALGSFQLSPACSWNPNLHAGVGQTHVRGTGSAEKSVIGGSVGLGVDKFVWRSLSLGASADWLWAARHGASRDVHAVKAAATIGWWFGGRRAAPAPVRAAAPAPAPAPAPVAQAPRDSDGDGVLDAADACPGTPAGTLVDLKGCQRAEKVSIELKVQFDTGKADIKPEFDEQLKKVGDFLKDYPATLVEVEGHTDDVGAEDANISLSQRRAEAVRAALIERFGANADKVTAKGYGPSRPVADNSSPEGRAQNRRVVATMTAEKR